MCLCGPGFSGTNASNGLASCVNINECEELICGSSLIQTCTDTNGGFICSCAAGFSGEDSEGSPATCENINECSARNQGVCSGGISDQICIDQEGSFTCACGLG